MSDTTVEGINVASAQKGSRKETDRKVSSFWIFGLDWLMMVSAWFEQLFVHAVVTFVNTGIIL